MQWQTFLDSMQQAEPPAGLPPELKALWYAGKKHWQQAHTLVQDETGKGAAHVHAFLHRQEGDTGNAAYWYRRAGAFMPTCTLQEEWATLVQTLLAAAQDA